MIVKSEEIYGILIKLEVTSIINGNFRLGFR